MTLTKEKLALYYSDEYRQHRLKVFTCLMFMALAVEKVLYSTTMTYTNGVVDFFFSLHLTDVICMMVYMATASLLVVHAEYKYLLIPDFVLLAVKLYNIIHGVVYLSSVENPTLLSELSVIEEVTESALFAMFLVAMFIGKLSKGKLLPNYYIICIGILICCFPATTTFEVLKIIAATEIHQYPLLIAFNFIKGVLDEAFLDLPYFLLILTICFTKHKRH